MTPTSPENIVKAQQFVIPDNVVSAIDQILVKKYKNGKAEILYKEIIECHPTIRKNRNICWQEVARGYQIAGWLIRGDYTNFETDDNIVMVFENRTR